MSDSEVPGRAVPGTGVFEYHATVSRAWVELAGYHVTLSDDGDVEPFAGRYPALLGKRMLARHYRSSALAAAGARSGWVEPGLKPLPGTGTCA